MCFLSSCCHLPAPVAGLCGRKKKGCGTKVAAFACKTATNFAVSLLSVFLVWLILFRPYQIRPTATAAVLTTFNNVTADTLRYDLALDLTFSNSHHFYSIRFDHLTVAAYYNGTKLGGSSSSDGDDELPSSFKLRPRRHRTIHPVLSGRAINVGGAVADEFSREGKRGRFTMEVVVKTTLTYKFWPNKAVYYHEYSCLLTFPDPAKADGGAHGVDGDVRCAVAK
ncbi:hypothetical protein CFC21_094945 [Triticum aestivum]|uniref:Late embryogenesis abundant protein LEA-2 subgroup domain-containing protein n=2 Tax=Triticum aestivum TaxID=4565 RepID=A0A3B6R9W9_WHEAT|nr:hypothetical protein CFC21_094945 [Triticum aestivum]